MKLHAIKATREKGDYLYLCSMWQGILSWTIANKLCEARSRILVFPEKAANEIMLAIRDVVPESWQLELVYTRDIYQQNNKYYIENIPNA